MSSYDSPADRAAERLNDLVAQRRITGKDLADTLAAQGCGIAVQDGSDAIALTPDTPITDLLGRRVLALPIDPVSGWTVRHYLIGLLCAFWNGNADFKYGMNGNSDWQHDLYRVLAEHHLVHRWAEGESIGTRAVDLRYYPEDEARADALIAAAIRQLNHY